MLKLNKKEFISLVDYLESVTIRRLILKSLRSKRLDSEKSKSNGRDYDLFKGDWIRIRLTSKVN